MKKMNGKMKKSHSGQEEGHFRFECDENFFQHVPKKYGELFVPILQTFFATVLALSWYKFAKVV
jgi:hypothetical protein